jgi:hypothetical protein
MNPRGSRPTIVAMRNVVMAVVTAVVLVGCSGAAASPSAVAPTAVAPSSPSAVAPSAVAPTPSSSSAIAPDGAGRIHAGPLEPGVYASTAFDPPLRFTLGDGWRALFPDEDSELALEHEAGSFLGFDRIKEVVDPTAGGAVDAPDDLVAWLLEHPGLDSAAGPSVELGGLSAISVDARTGDAEVEIFAYPLGNWRMPPRHASRFYVVPMDGLDLVVVVLAPIANIDAAIERVEPIIESVELLPAEP